MKDFKENLLNLIAKNEVKKVLQILSDSINKESDRYNDFVKISARYNGLLDLKMINTIDFSQFILETNKINDTILWFIDKLSSDEIYESKDSSAEYIDNPILIVFSSEDYRIDEILKETDLSNITAISIDEQIPDEKFDLIIFDNRDLKTCYNEKALEAFSPKEQHLISNRIALMNKYLENTSNFIIHFGEILYWVNNNRERVHAANSKFSLYARTKEMLAFINSYRVE